MPSQLCMPAAMLHAVSIKALSSFHLSSINQSAVNTIISYPRMSPDRFITKPFKNGPPRTRCYCDPILAYLRAFTPSSTSYLTPPCYPLSRHCASYVHVSMA